MKTNWKQLISIGNNVYPIMLITEQKIKGNQILVASPNPQFISLHLSYFFIMFVVTFINCFGIISAYSVILARSSYTDRGLDNFLLKATPKQKVEFVEHDRHSIRTLFGSFFTIFIQPFPYHYCVMHWRPI